MAELATIARPYAEALFKACASDPGSALEWLGELSAIAAATAAMLQFADSPKATAEQVFGLGCRGDE
jgi:F-type H+-transporting ATPase subunit delta